jgi:hypothetical protein
MNLFSSTTSQSNKTTFLRNAKVFLSEFGSAKTNKSENKKSPRFNADFEIAKSLAFFFFS